MSHHLRLPALLMILLVSSHSSFAADAAATKGNSFNPGGTSGTSFNPGGTSDSSFNPGGSANQAPNPTRYNAMPDTTNPAELAPISSSKAGAGTSTNTNYQGAVPQSGTTVVHSATPTTTLNAGVNTPQNNAPQTGAINANTAPMPKPTAGGPGLPQAGAINANTTSP